MRAWTITRGTKAPQAAGKIHSDFERGFIRAEVVNYQDLLDCGSYAGAREKGLVRMEGKEYVVQDGDVILTLSEKAGAGRKVRKAHVPSGVIESIRVLADTTAVEIYVNGGEVVFSSRYYPETQEQTVKVEAVECNGKIYMLKNYVMV